MNKPPCKALFICTLLAASRSTLYHTAMLLKKAPLFQKQLLGWYRKNARDLPWRRTRDPYKIWISEIMLQQTQVQTVIPYYERWLKRFPDIKTLAKAPESEVMKHWAGLGYYRRARMLHAAAKKIGQIPRTAKELLELPGIGRYTAGAIASIAYGERIPVLDGNVIRILTRLTALKDDIGKPKTIEKLWKIATALVPSKNSGDFNQAMMELGATVCTPQNPACLLCPVTALCEGRKNGNPESFPFKKEKIKLEKIKTAALILHKNGKVLLQKQSAKERWGGLWVFPFEKDIRSILEKFRIPEIDLKHKLTIRHGFTKYQISLKVYEGPLLTSPHKSGGRDRADRQKWFKIKELSHLAFPSPHQKIVKELLKNHVS